MPGRHLCIVKRERAMTVGICEACNEQFSSHKLPRSQSEWEIKILFDSTNTERQLNELYAT
jgi:hypothetical protein